jgi:hypothetical protein
MKNGVPNEILTAFSDGMHRTRVVPAAEYYGLDYDAEDDVQAHELTCPGSIAAARLTLLSVSETMCLTALDELLRERRAEIQEGLGDWENSQVLADYYSAEHAYLADYDARRWVADLQSSVDGGDEETRLSLGSRAWLLHLLEDVDYRIALRAVLIAFPDGEVKIDLTDLLDGGWIEDPPFNLCSHALDIVRADTASYSPLVVITEGRSDIDVLKPALELVYPHLVDLVKFMDYSGRPEGGAGALVRTIRAFAAAGIANRVIALFDNDTAASDALRSLDPTSLPANIRVRQYPDLDLARNYPTLGPPDTLHPTGYLSVADVNGLAGSIELYLGEDLLFDGDRCIHPVQWRSYIPGMRKYQGEVIGKDQIQEEFQRKLKAAGLDRTRMEAQDWNGVRAILDCIIAAF